jgi:ankyrin repeat protein
VAAMRGDEAEVRLLLDQQDVNPDFKCEGRTALWWAADKGHCGVVGLLLERSINPNANDDGRTPLIIAVQHGHEQVVRLLLRRRDVNPVVKTNTGDRLSTPTT